MIEGREKGELSSSNRIFDAEQEWAKDPGSGHRKSNRSSDASTPRRTAADGRDLVGDSLNSALRRPIDASADVLASEGPLLRALPDRRSLEEAQLDPDFRQLVSDFLLRVEKAVSATGLPYSITLRWQQDLEEEGWTRWIVRARIPRTSREERNLMWDSLIEQYTDLVSRTLRDRPGREARRKLKSLAESLFLEMEMR
jgi:hypothetical protein